MTGEVPQEPARHERIAEASATNAHGRAGSSRWLLEGFSGAHLLPMAAFEVSPMRLEHLTEEEEDGWRAEFAQENWIFGALALSVTLPEFSGGVPALRTMHFGYYLQPLHLNADDREDLPRKLVHVLARRRPPLDFFELSGAGLRIPHAFPHGFTLGSVLRITLQELKRLPLRDESIRRESN